MNKKLRIIIALIFGIVLFSCNSENEPDKDKDSIDQLSKALPHLYISVDTASWQTITELRNVALENDIISKEEKKKFLALIGNQVTDTASIRLKGDWTDHLIGEKWSLRIKMKSGHFLNRKQFSIQAPNTRNFLKEWLFHKLLMEEGILTTKYEFINVSINGVNKGVYAFEEHFKKELLEFQGRREGPLLKFDESTFWQLQQAEKQLDQDFDFLYPFFENSEILPFSKGKTCKDSANLMLFYEARNKLLGYKEGKLKVSEVFDIDLLAKLYALFDIFKGYHGLTWHNQRFYYNPISKLFEPVVFDVFTEDEDFLIVRKPFLGYGLRDKHISYFGEVHYIFQAFNDSVFRTKYFDYLEDYLATDWLSRIEAYGQEIKFLEEQIQLDYSDYEFDTKRFISNASVVKDSLQEYTSRNPPFKTFEYYPYQKWMEDNRDGEFVKNLTVDTLLMASMALKVYLEYTTNQFFQLKVTNQHLKPIKVFGYTAQKSGQIHNLSGSFTLNGYDNLQARVTRKVSVPDSAKYIVYICQNDTLSKKISPFNYPFDYDPTTSSVIHKSGDQTFFKGEYIIDNTTVFDENSSVFIEEGSKISLENGANLIFKGSVLFEGSVEHPINITSVDSGSKVLILNSQEAEISYTVFSNFSSKHFDSRTGAITVYNSNVHFDKCSFDNINCEDALNIVNSRFKVSNCTFDHASSDAIDVDFGEGVISNTSIQNAGNDGIDLSATSTVIMSCSVSNCGDKGISIGEAADIQINNTTIDNVLSGIAVKDQSVAKINSCSISNAKTGIYLFQKKDHYYEPEAIISIIDFKNVELQTLVLEGKLFQDEP